MAEQMVNHSTESAVFGDNLSQLAQREGDVVLRDGSTVSVRIMLLAYGWPLSHDRL